MASHEKKKLVSDFVMKINGKIFKAMDILAG